jgi:hypothetical protein
LVKTQIKKIDTCSMPGAAAASTGSAAAADDDEELAAEAAWPLPTPSSPSTTAYGSGSCSRL